MTTEVTFTYPNNICFACLECGLCCGDTPNKTRHVLLLQQDAERIAAHVKRPISSFAVEVSEKAPYLFEICKNAETGMCLFLKDIRCTIYEQRPLVCRFYPFELTTNENEAFVFKETDECPGINRSKSKGRKRISQLFFAELLELARSELGKAYN